MKITLLAYGTRGDVQPMAALGAGLRQAGHQVRLAAPGAFAGLAASLGIEFTPLPGDPAALSRELTDRAGANPLGIMRAIFEHAIPLGLGVREAALDASHDADLIVHSFLLTVLGHEIALARGVPEVSALLYPLFTPTGEFPGMMFPARSFGGAYNRWTHRVFDRVFWQANRLGYAFVRRTHRELPPLHGWPFDGPRPALALYGFSRHVVARPPDWPDHAQVTGFWFLPGDSDWHPPDELAAFLEAGPPPVAISFSSIVTRDAAHLSEVIREAVRISGQRAVILGGWGAFSGGTNSDSLLGIEAAPHDWLFPRMAAVVHHGGAGTTAAGLRAGVPSILIPFTSDQPWWGRQVHRLGVGPQPIPRNRLTAERLAEAITAAVGDQAMRDRASKLGEAIRAEDGVGEAVGVIAQIVD